MIINHSNIIFLLIVYLGFFSSQVYASPDSSASILEKVDKIDEFARSFVQDDLKKNILFYQGVLNKTNKLDYSKVRQDALYNLGKIYLKTNDYENAEIFLKSALDISQKLKDSSSINLTLLLLSELSYKKGEFNRAYHFISKLFVDQIDENKELMKLNLLMYNIYSKLGATDKSINMFYDYIKYKRLNYLDVYNEKKSGFDKQIESVKNSIEVDEIDEKVERITKTETQNQNLLIIFSISSFFVLSVLILLMYDRHKNKLEMVGIINKQNDDLISSIQYAERIQAAILPKNESIRALLPESYTLFIPREIVSGDFYWCAEMDGKSYIAVVDCIGYGVRGAFLSMIGTTLLNQIVIEDKVSNPSEILFQLSQRFAKALAQENTGVADDNMEVCLVRIDQKSNHITFSGAGRPLFIAKSDGVQILDGDQMHIGGDGLIEGNQFTDHEIDFDEEVVIYLSSEGFTSDNTKNDELREKFQISEIINRFHKTPLYDQSKAIQKELESHDYKNIQNEDFTIIGIKLKKI